MDTKPPDQELRRYVLGDLNPDEMDEIESRYPAPREFLHRLDEAADELCDDYVHGRLTQTEREKVEALSVSPAWRDRIEFAQALANGQVRSNSGTSSANTRVTPIERRFRIPPRVAELVAIAAGLVVLIGTPAALSQLRELRQQLDQRSREVDSARGEAQTANQQLEAERARSAELQRTVDRQSTVQYSLLPLRRAADSPVLSVPREAAFVRLQLALDPGVSVTNYRALLRDPAGSEVSGEQNRLETGPAATITLVVPAQAFAQNGQYQLTLQSIESGTARDLAVYTFRVNRR
jgi:hypothetical protein